MAQDSFLNPAMPDIIEQWRAYFRLLELQPCHTILDVGCNTGDADRFLLRLYPYVKMVVGIDNSYSRVQRAQARILAEYGPGTQCSFMQAPAECLPFPANSYDRVLCVEMLEWVDEPEDVLREVHRVLKPGGVALVIHTDFDTQVFSPADLGLHREVVHRFTDTGPDGTIGRMLTELCTTAGFDEVRPSVYPLINREFSSQMYSQQVFEMMVEWIGGADHKLYGELQKWKEELNSASESGRFFYSVNRNICLCEKRK